MGEFTRIPKAGASCLLVILAMSCLFLASSPAVLGADLRLFGGLTATMSTHGDFYQTSGTGFFLGGGSEMALTPHLALEIDALYFQKGRYTALFRENNDPGGLIFMTIPYEINELSFPALVKVSLHPRNSPYLLGGAELAVNLSSSSIKTLNYGLVAGIGFRYGAFCAEVRYHHGLSDVMKDYLPSKMRAVAFVLGYSI